tara:strand:+ start:5690 stop:5884 length:195 start_codon:yes stop_codon:yes gene_type:complete
MATLFYRKEKHMAREENTTQSEIDEWLAKGNKITYLKAFAKTAPENIEYMHKRRPADKKPKKEK